MEQLGRGAGRERNSRFVEVDGDLVLKINNYSLEASLRLSLRARARARARVIDPNPDPRLGLELGSLLAVQPYPCPCLQAGGREERLRLGAQGQDRPAEQAQVGARAGGQGLRELFPVPAVLGRWRHDLLRLLPQRDARRVLSPISPYISLYLPISPEQLLLLVHKPGDDPAFEEHGRPQGAPSRPTHPPSTSEASSVPL